MAYQGLVGQYKKLNVETAGRLDLVIMCYEKAIELIYQARKHFEEGHYESKAKKLQKALDILHELLNCLNHEKGGQIATNLAALYTYLIRRLMEGNIRKELEAFDEAIRILSELREAWQGLAAGQDTKLPSSGSASQPRRALEQLAA